MHEDERRRRAARKDFIRTHHPDRGGDITEFVIGLAQFDRESPETAASAHLRIVFVPHTSWPRRLLRAVFSALHRRLPLRHRKPLTPTQRNREKT
jgi:hypothetical protein